MATSNSDLLQEDVYTLTLNRMVEAMATCLQHGQMLSDNHNSYSTSVPLTPSSCLSPFSNIWWQILVTLSNDSSGSSRVKVPSANCKSMGCFLSDLHCAQHWQHCICHQQTNRQTKKQLNVFGRPTAGEIRAPPNLAWW